MNKNDQGSSTEQFEMHPQMLFDVIQRQAGTLGKALLEGMMNSADAKATECRITLTPTEVRIQDDGVGFKDKDQINRFFKTFGTPHTADEHKTYGTFRMGRGQLFSFGVNDWESGTFKMHVDIKNDGLNWKLSTGASVKGCSIIIKLYQKLLPSQIADVEKEVKKLGKYIEMAGTKCYLNDEKFTSDPENEPQDKWDQVTPEAFIKLRSSSSCLSVFNLGAFVKDFGGWQFGVGGEVVSRQQLRVNFARNDIMVSNCKVWKKIRPIIDQRATAQNKKKKVHSDYERQRLADQFRSGEFSEAEARDLPLLTDVCGRHWSIRKLNLWRYDYKMSVAKLGDRKGDTIHQQRVAFVMAQETLDRFEAKNLPALLKMLRKVTDTYSHIFDEIKVMPFEKLINGMSDVHIVLGNKEWTANEKIWIETLDVVVKWIEYVNYQERYQEDDNSEREDIRKVVVGKSDTADGWTDGSTMIAVSRRFIQGLAFNASGVIDACTLLFHELSHDAADLEGHDHSMEFYQTYHDMTVKYFGKIVQDTLAHLPKRLESAGKKLNKASLKQQDVQVKLEQSLGKYGVAARDTVLSEKEPDKAVKTPDKAETVPDKGNPYRGSYGIIFDEGSKGFKDKDEIIKAAVVRAGKSEDNIRMSYQVLRDSNHRSNGGRSEEVQQADGKVMLVTVKS